jgi:hypothetical protein
MRQPSHHLCRRASRSRPLLGAFLLALAGCSTAVSTSRVAGPSNATTGACFDTRGADPARVRRAESLLLDASDGEGLYTLAGGLKPLSSGRAFTVRIAPTLDRAALDSLEQVRHTLALLHCGDIGAFVHAFTAPQGDSIVRRSFDVIVYHRPSVARAIAQHAEFFGTLGVTPGADVREALAAVENAPRAERWRGYGVLFGYPDDAVDFFVRAGVEGDRTQTIVPRDFRRIETYRKFPVERDGPPVASSFVYAVPKDAPESSADRTLRDAAAPIYARYVRERARRITADSTGALALWRAWLSGR